MFTTFTLGGDNYTPTHAAAPTAHVNTVTVYQSIDSYHMFI